MIYLLFPEILFFVYIIRFIGKIVKYQTAFFNLISLFLIFSHFFPLLFNSLSSAKHKNAKAGITLKNVLKRAIAVPIATEEEKAFTKKSLKQTTAKKKNTAPKRLKNKLKRAVFPASSFLPTESKRTGTQLPTLAPKTRKTEL